MSGDVDEMLMELRRGAADGDADEALRELRGQQPAATKTPLNIRQANFREPDDPKTRDEPFFRAAEKNISSQSMGTLTAAIDKLPSDERVRQARAEIERVADPELRLRLHKKLDAQEVTIRAIREGVQRRTAMEQEYANQRAIGLTRRTKKVYLGGGGMMEVQDDGPETLAGLEEEGRQEAERARHREIGTRIGTAPLRGAMWGLDLAHRGFVRTPTAMLGGGYSFDQAWSMPSEEWAKKVVNVMENDDTMRGTVARIGAGVPAALGATVGAAVGAPTIVAGALANAINGDIPSPEQSVKNAQQTFKDTARSGAELGVQILTDPLSLVSLGGTSKGALAALRAAGREAELGKYAGQSFLRVHPPFMSELSKPIGTPYAFRDWFGKVTGETGRNAIDAIATKGLQSEPIYNTALRDQMRLERAARGDEAIVRQEMADRFKQGVEALPEEFKAKLADPKFRSEWYRRHAEHRDWERQTGLAAEPTQVAANQRVLPANDGTFHSLTAGDDFVPYEKLDETFGAGAQQFTDLVKQRSNEWKDLLVERGYLTPDQAAVNPFSGIYLRRPMSSRYGIFDELAAKPGRGDPGAGYTALEKARVGAAEGFPGGMSNAELPSYVQVGQQSFIDRALGRAPQVDPFELISGYNRLGARAAAETTFRQKMAAQFGREVAAGDKSGKNLGASVVRVKQPDGTTVERVLDPEVANRMQQVFAPASGKLGNLARSTVGTETAAKRTLVAAGDAVDKGRSLFKSLALKSPSYHSTNYVNDMLWRAMAGEKNALANNTRAAELLAGAGTDADKAIMRALQEAGLPIEPGSHRFDLDPSKGLAQDLQSMIQPESAARDIYRAIAPAELGGTARSRGFGEMMEARQKLGHALYWMDQGATPEEAVAKTFSTLLDYQSRDTFERGLTYAAPFSAFMSKSPRRAARFLLAKPGAAMSLDRTLRSFDDNTDFEPRESTLNQGPALRVGGATRDAINAWMKVLANQYNRLGPGERAGPAEGVPQGLTTVLQPKLDLYDAFVPFRSLDNLGMTMQPDVKAALEILTNRDLVANRDFDGWSLSVPQGSGLGRFGFPVANKDENPALARYAPQYLFDRGTMMLLNHALGMQQEGGPVSTLGAARYFQPDMDRRNVYAQQLLSYLFPFRVQIDDPVSGIANATNSREVKKAIKNEQEARARDEQYRRR